MGEIIEMRSMRTDEEKDLVKFLRNRLIGTARSKSKVEIVRRFVNGELFRRSVRALNSDGAFESFHLRQQ